MEKLEHLYSFAILCGVLGRYSEMVDWENKGLGLNIYIRYYQKPPSVKLLFPASFSPKDKSFIFVLLLPLLLPRREIPRNAEEPFWKILTLAMFLGEYFKYTLIFPRHVLCCWLFFFFKFFFGGGCWVCILTGFRDALCDNATKNLIPSSKQSQFPAQGVGGPVFDIAC